MQRKYGLIGKGISYSKSKWIFEQYFKDNKDLNYEIYDIDKIDKNFLLQFNGLNVTTPYKIEVINFLDSIDNIAEEIGSVNCILNSNGKLIGYNTDYLGFDSLMRMGAKNMLLLGNGGVSKMIQWYCKRNNIELTIVGRNASKGYKDITYDKLNNYSKYDHIVNATKFGILPPIDYTKINKDARIIDLSYIDGNDDTVFIKEFFKNGYTNLEDGFGMLIRQALSSYKIWGIL